MLVRVQLGRSRPAVPAVTPDLTAVSPRGLWEEVTATRLHVTQTAVTARRLQVATISVS